MEKKREETEGGKLMGSFSGNQKLEFDMVKKQNNCKNQTDCDIIRVTSKEDYFSTHGPKWE